MCASLCTRIPVCLHIPGCIPGHILVLLCPCACAFMDPRAPLPCITKLCRCHRGQINLPRCTQHTLTNGATLRILMKSQLPFLESVFILLKWVRLCLCVCQGPFKCGRKSHYLMLEPFKMFLLGYLTQEEKKGALFRVCFGTTEKASG